MTACIFQVVIDEADVRCETDYVNIIVPGLYMNLFGQDSVVSLCNKIEKNSLVKHFQSEEQWSRFYHKFTNRTAVVEECWVGGRKLVWMPYVDMDGDFVFQHALTGEPVYPPNGAWMPG